MPGRNLEIRINILADIKYGGQSKIGKKDGRRKTEDVKNSERVKNVSKRI